MAKRGGAVVGVARVYRSRAGNVLVSLFTFVRRNPFGAVSFFVLLAMGLIAILAPLIAPEDPLRIHLTVRLKPPNADSLLGTDYIGRDVLSRVMYGSRISLLIALTSVLVGTTLGSLWGLASGYFGGRIDMYSQRLVEIMLSFPSIILAMLLVVSFSPGISTVIVAITVVRIPTSARVLRSTALMLREQTYIEAARSVGASDLRILFRHVLPNAIAPYLIVASAGLGTAVLIEASLGFLGLGVPPPTPTWGNMLGGLVTMSTSPPLWLVLPPGVALATTVLSFNLLGDALRDTLDPRLRGA